MELEFKHLAPYLPYGLKVQFEGIINGKELGEHDKRYKEATKDDMFADFKEQRPGEIKGLKIGDIKIIEVCKKFTKYRIGGKGKQTHYGTERFKPVLRPLSDLVKDVEINGKIFNPLAVLCKDFGSRIPCNISFGDETLMHADNDGGCKWWFYYNKEKRCFELTEDDKEMRSNNLPQYDMMCKLFEWHFDVFELIGKGLAVNVHCQTSSPFENECVALAGEIA